MQSYNNSPYSKKLHFIPDFGSGGEGYLATPISSASRRPRPLPLTRPRVAREVAQSAPTHSPIARLFMEMLNPHCRGDRDPRGGVRLTLCNAGSLNILGSAVINGVREGLEILATDRQIRVLVIAGQSEKN